ncbi:MAG: C13 family peptidase, partial [Xanthobacteraceae bacterium]
PQRKGVTDIYAIGVAGWADQDVFAKELDGGLAAIASVLPIKDRTIRLINHRETIAHVPLANLQNFAAAVRAVGDAMDKDEDILILLMTSHGERGGFALQLPGNVTTELTPQQVASTLDAEGIKYRVVIVSACYSGIFLPPLANDNTIVMTAADDKSASFGCAPERDWTYFGDALFRQSLQPGTDFQRAFDHARILIRGWELMEGAAPSNPQAHFGPALVGTLAPSFAAAPASAGQ